MKHYTYYTTGPCSSQIDLAIDDDGRIENVTFVGGCHGNTQGISVLVKGMKMEDVVAKLEGIRCGYKNTSCPDQLARALREVMSKD